VRQAWTSALAAIGLIVAQAIALAGIAATVYWHVADAHRGDLQLYQRAGQRLLQGQLPYRDFPLEYPPAALVVFVAPHVVRGQILALPAYINTFLAQSVALSTIIAATLGLIAWRWWPGRPVVPVLGGYLAAVIAGAQMLAFRYDVFPAAMTALALAGVLANRPVVAGLFLGIGIAAKLYPAVMLAVVGLAYLAQRRIGWCLRLALGTLAPLILAAAPLLAPDTVSRLGTLGFYTQRGVQVESIPGGALLAANVLGLARVGVSHAFGAHQISSPIADAITRWQPLVFVVAMAAVFALIWWRFRADVAARGAVSPQSLVASLTLALLVFIVANKVFSAQHLIWLLPFGPLLPWRQGVLLLVAWALTNVHYPWTYLDFIDSGPFAVALLNLRNIAVVALIVWLVVDLLRPATVTTPVRQAADQPAT
jgi:hypothetical protein